MKIKFQGELSIAQITQVIFEQLHQMEYDLRVRHYKDITIYLTPTNGLGHTTYCRDKHGKEIKVIFCNGPYKSAAEDYDP